MMCINRLESWNALIVSSAALPHSPSSKTLGLHTCTHILTKQTIASLVDFMSCAKRLSSPVQNARMNRVELVAKPITSHCVVSKFWNVRWTRIDGAWKKPESMEEAMTAAMVQPVPQLSQIAHPGVTNSRQQDGIDHETNAA
jgi:hypothetical protein